MRYIILHGRTCEELGEKVNRELTDGWQLHGDPFALIAESGQREFYQALWKPPGNQPAEEKKS